MVGEPSYLCTPLPLPHCLLCVFFFFIVSFSWQDHRGSKLQLWHSFQDGELNVHFANVKMGSIAFTFVSIAT